MKVRKAILSDADTIADFNIRLAWETEHLKLIPETVRAGVAALLKDASKGTYFVAEDPASGVVGQLMITFEWSDWRNGDIWWIQSVYVKSEFRGNGVFKMLFDHVEQLAKQEGKARSIRLYVEKDNKRAHRAYEKLGMELSHYLVFEKLMS